MYSWHVTVWTKGGRIYDGYHRSKESDSRRALRELVPEKLGVNEQCWFSIMVNEGKVITIRLSEVEAIALEVTKK